MYERKQNGEVFFSSLCVTYSRFGNYPANGLVTEQPQYSVVVCIFSTSQNTEISLIPNGLRLIYTCSLLLALPCIFHGEKAHSRYFGEDAFKKLTGDNKELMIIPGASHTDLYDNLALIPFDKLETFFKENLK